MEFDITSFVFGGAATILGLEIAKLAGFTAGMVYARIEHRRSPMESIDSISNRSARTTSGS